MSQQAKMKVGIAGAGNVATHLATAIKKSGHEIVAVVSKSYCTAEALAGKLNAVAIRNVEEMPSDLDFVLIASSDAAVSEISDRLPQIKGIVAHTSGSVPLEALSTRHVHAAVLYPLQTFTKDVPVDISKVPFFVEATDESALRTIESIAGELSERVHHADSVTRSRLHIAGVLSSNFPIYLLEMTRKVLSEQGLPLDTVKPLVKATIEKAFSTEPLAALTGPARRGDVEVVRKQSASFDSQIDKDIYDSISKAIFSEFGHKYE